MIVALLVYEYGCWYTAMIVALLAYEYGHFVCVYSFQWELWQCVHCLLMRPCVKGSFISLSTPSGYQHHTVMTPHCDLSLSEWFQPTSPVKSSWSPLWSVTGALCVLFKAQWTCMHNYIAHVQLSHTNICYPPYFGLLKTHFICLYFTISINLCCTLVQYRQILLESKIVTVLYRNLIPAHGCALVVCVVEVFKLAPALHHCPWITKGD